jgi:hypothetical protein
MFKHHEPPPPAYAASSYQQGPNYTDQVLTSSSHGVTVSISLPPDRSAFHPSEILPLILSLPIAELNDLKDELQVHLEGSSTVAIMGKSRYQVCCAYFSTYHYYPTYMQYY